MLIKAIMTYGAYKIGPLHELLMKCFNFREKNFLSLVLLYLTFLILISTQNVRYI